jgi:hypothetical protein
MGPPKSKISGPISPGSAGPWMLALSELKVQAGTLSRKLNEFPVNENCPVKIVGSLLGGTSLAPLRFAIN